MVRRDEMRAADADREAVAERLRAALNEGRLDLQEYDDRLRRAYTAKTYGDLDGLLADLPGTIPAQRAQVAPIGAAEVATPEPAPAAAVTYPDATRRWLAETWSGYVGVVCLTVAIWAVICVMSQDLIYFWPGWVAGPWGVVLLVSTITGLMSGEPQKWAARRARQERAKADKRAAKHVESGDDD